MEVTKKKLFIIMCGIPGVGKTTLAQDLKQKFSYTIIQSPKRKGTALFPITRTARDDYLWFAHGYHGMDFNPVIFDATFHTYEKRRHVYRYAMERGIDLLLINVEADTETIYRRLEEQNRTKTKKLYCSINQLIELYVSTYQNPINDEEHQPIITVNTVNNRVRVYNSCNTGEIARILEYLKTKNPVLLND